MAEMQRRRLLNAIFEVVAEHGAQALTATLVCERAGTSRRTFYELFGGREGCLLAAFEDAVRQATQAVQRAAEGREKWCERVRAGLTGLLEFFDRDPNVARLLVVEALSCGERTLNARRGVLERFIMIVDEGRTEGKTVADPSALTAEGVVGAVFGVIHARMLAREQEPFGGLAGSLMAMIVQPYLGSAAARRELERPHVTERPVVARSSADPFKGLSMRLTYRTARVLNSIAAAPGSSSKQVARAAGIADEGQTSKLLARLQTYGLIEDTGMGPIKGLPRAWALTERGAGIVQAVGEG